MSQLVLSSLDIARGEVGAREIGNTNTGVKVNAYLHSVGVAPGNPWCAAFAYWCMQQAANALGVNNPFIRTGYTPTISSWATENGILFDRPLVGDTFLLYGNTSDGFRAHHTGFVTSVNADGTFGTIEGNTNLDGSADGYGVFARKRPINASYRFVRWDKLVPAPVPEVYHLVISGTPLLDMPVVDQRALCPIRAWGEKLGFTVGFADGHVTFDGSPVAAEVSIIDNKAYAPIRQLAVSAGLKMDVDAATKTVNITR